MDLIRRTHFPSLALPEDAPTLLKRFFGPAWEQGGAFPPVNLEETDKDIVVTAELPGVDAKDVSVTNHGRELVIQGEKKTSRTEKKANYHLEEMTYGSFSRRLLLPCEVVTDKASADFKSGVLCITLPKAESVRKNKIPIQVAKG